MSGSLDRCCKDHGHRGEAEAANPPDSVSYDSLALRHEEDDDSDDSDDEDPECGSSFKYRSIS